MSAQTESAQWWNAWGQLKAALSRLDQAVASLQRNRDFALARANLRDTYNAKMAEIESMRSKAIWLRDSIRQVMGFLGVELSGLGALPVAALVLWPTVAAGIAWLGSKALDLWKFAQQVEEQQRLESQGVAPAQAAALVQQKADSGTLVGALKVAAPLLLVAAGVWWWFGRRR